MYGLAYDKDAMIYGLASDKDVMISRKLFYREACGVKGEKKVTYSIWKSIDISPFWIPCIEYEQIRS